MRAIDCPALYQTPPSRVKITPAGFVAYRRETLDRVDLKPDACTSPGQETMLAQLLGMKQHPSRRADPMGMPRRDQDTQAAGRAGGRG
jgi:hypothetical protein